ncbi:hypothetical protein Poly41_62650 [Novipirellula artificiosorum]|uniref:Uncharacterized protein n=1 Tax=Novipirellula artificiosorum TaxID=2528016 RepID=A0A5C6D839_9BACT|nr:hypothetical protein Poly41_62650 [Novipirellula artificiosorum]
MAGPMLPSNFVLQGLYVFGGNVWDTRCIVLQASKERQGESLIILVKSTTI